MTNIVYDNIVTVSEGDRDVDTQMDIQYDDRIVFSADGEIWAGVWLTGLNGPQGWNNITYDPQFPLPGTHPYCLLGRLDGRLLHVGKGFDRYYRGNNSRLFLRINDDQPGNGSGAFFCSIQVYRETVAAMSGLITSIRPQVSQPVAAPQVSRVEQSDVRA